MFNDRIKRRQHSVVLQKLITSLATISSGLSTVSPTPTFIWQAQQNQPRHSKPLPWQGAQLPDWQDKQPI
jgi:hypothetical protein